MFLLFSILFFVSCDWNNGRRPIDQDGTFWATDDIKMYFRVDRKKSGSSLGMFFDEEDIKFRFVFEGDWVGIIDVEKEKLYSFHEAVIIEGKCNFNKTKFTITITESHIDSVTIGDKITFNRIDELPKWIVDDAINFD